MQLKPPILDYSLEELTNILSEFGAQNYRAKQLFKWANSGANFSQMSNLSKDFLASIAGIMTDRVLQIAKTVRSSDGSEKHLYKLTDANFIEGVFLPNNYGNTLCVSTQVGCKMGCKFCASGSNGLVRNLSAGEIVGQYVEAVKRIGGEAIAKTGIEKQAKPITNIVFMGSGEPLDNYENTVKAIRLLTCAEGLNISCRNISISTCGVVPKMQSLANEGLGITLSVSLHATTDEVRKTIMPTAKKYSIAQILTAAKNYFINSGRRVCIEYALIKGVNDSHEDAVRLSSLTKGFSTHVNLLTLNAVKGSNLSAPSSVKVKSFLIALQRLNVSASLRRSSGNEVLGACGQLMGAKV